MQALKFHRLFLVSGIDSRCYRPMQRLTGNVLQPCWNNFWYVFFDQLF